MLKIIKYFNIHNTHEEQRISVTSFYLDGPHLVGLWMFHNNQLTAWTNFLHALPKAFVPSHFPDLQGASFKLIQTSIFRTTKLSLNCFKQSYWSPPHS